MEIAATPGFFTSSPNSQQAYLFDCIFSLHAAKGQRLYFIKASPPQHHTATREAVVIKHNASRTLDIVAAFTWQLNQ